LGAFSKRHCNRNNGLTMNAARGSLLGIEPLDAPEILKILKFARSMNPDKPRALLKGKRIALLFYEASTRTRSSFEIAAKALGAYTVVVHASGSSIEKGESLLDTGYTLRAVGADVIVIRHPQAGAAALFARKQWYGWAMEQFAIRPFYVHAAALVLVAAEYKAFGTSKRFNASRGPYSANYGAQPFPGMNADTYSTLRSHPEYRLALDVTALFPQNLRHNAPQKAPIAHMSQMHVANQRRRPPTRGCVRSGVVAIFQRWRD
jgi:hypothetical protein